MRNQQLNMQGNVMNFDICRNVPLSEGIVFELQSILLMDSNVPQIEIQKKYMNKKQKLAVYITLLSMKKSNRIFLTSNDYIYVVGFK